jgi:hypothetical protein
VRWKTPKLSKNEISPLRKSEPSVLIPPDILLKSLPLLPLLLLLLWQNNGIAANGENKT